MEHLSTVITSAIKELFDCDVSPQIERPDAGHGDFTTNCALQLAGRLQRSPRDIARALQGRLKAEPMIAAIDIAGPGFINITITDEAVAAAVAEIVDQKAAYGSNKSLSGKTIVAEYSDPNPFKQLHAGHLYTSIVGDAIANLLAACGATVKRANFGGDVGLHVGKTMWAIERALGGWHPDKLDGIVPEVRLDWLSARYVEGNEAYETDAEAKTVIADYNKRVYSLHETDDHQSAFAIIYWTCREWSYDGFKQLYERLQMVPFDVYYPESQTTPPGLAAVQDGLQSGVFSRSEGAVVYSGEAQGLHTRVFITGEGLPTYETKDLGLALQKWQDFQFDASIMITGNDIIEYMKVVLAALARIRPEIVQRSTHLTHGMVKLAGGEKMSSRKGNVLSANDVLEAANQSYAKQYDKQDFDVSLAAVKYAFLKHRIGGDILFDVEESVSLEGNSGPYLQYALVRARSILRKAPEASEAVSPEAYQQPERQLALKLSEYPEIVSKAANEHYPHHVCTYLFELAQTFNRFYEQCQIIGDEREAFRLVLVRSYEQILSNGLGLLGIPRPEHM